MFRRGLFIVRGDVLVNPQRTTSVTGAACFVALLVASALPLQAQRRGNGGYNNYFGCPNPPVHNVPYDGRFTFMRVIYTGGPGTCYYRGEPSWAHGYGYTDNGTAESNLLKITTEISA